MKSPAFQFYPGDWLSSMSVTMMTPAQEGAYIRLICYDWSNDGIPDDDDSLASLSRMGEGWLKGGSTTIKKCFIPHPTKSGFLTNFRLQTEREKQDVWREKSAIGGKKSAEARKQKALERSQGSLKGGSNLVQPNGNSSSSSSSSSSTSIREREKSALALSSPTPKTKTDPSPPTRPPAKSEFHDRMPSDAANDFDALFAQINGMHPTWKKRPHPTHIEMETAANNAKALFAIEAADWDSLRAFYAIATFPPEWEEKAKGGPFWRPESRSRFIEGIADILGHHDRWQALKRKGGATA